MTLNVADYSLKGRSAVNDSNVAQELVPKD
jgi:hypothetical protein